MCVQPPSPVCILLSPSLWRGWRGVRPEGGGRAGNGGRRWGTPKSTSQQCFITSNNIRNEVLVFICFNFLQMWTTGAQTPSALTKPRGVMCVKRDAFFKKGFLCTGKYVFKKKKSSNLTGLIQRWSEIFVRRSEFWRNVCKSSLNVVSCSRNL